MTDEDRSKVERIRELADDVREKMLAKDAWLAETRGPFVIRVTPPHDSKGGYKIELEAKA